MTWKNSLALFLFFVGLYLLTSPGHLYTIDSKVSFETTQSLVTKGNLDVSGNRITVKDAEGHSTGRYGLLQMVLCIPLYLGGQAMDAMFPNPDFLYENWRITLVATFNQFVAAVGLVLFYLILRELGGKHPACLAATLSLGFATPWWTYSRDLFRQPIAGVLFLWAIWGVLRYGNSRRKSGLLEAAIATGLSITNRITVVVAWPGLFLLLVSRVWGENRKKILQLISITTILVTVGILLQIATNYWRFGHWWGWAYTERIFSLSFIPRNVPDLLLSPARGLFLFCPALIFVFHGAMATWRKDRGLAAAIALMFAAKMALFGTYYDYTGGMNPGPRYLIPIMPVLYLYVGVLAITEWKQKSFRYPFYFFSGIGFIANGFNSITPYHLSMTFWDQVSRYFGIEKYEGRRPWDTKQEFYDVLIGRWILDGHYAVLVIYVTIIGALIAVSLYWLLPTLRSREE
ncbi:MAG: glycosyltransferase family 39 protein [Candidatus Omnitrophica bacterium]|nr:glycosyltransferase family 39 protein [Candidatus Omnitrophota bacterium]